MSVTAWPFIAIDDRGVAHLDGTGTKVLEVVLDHLAYAWDAEEIHRQHPALSLPQIHAALGYYFENREECDRLIDEQLRRTDELRQKLENPAVRSKLEAVKRGR